MKLYMHVHTCTYMYGTLHVSYSFSFEDSWSLTCFRYIIYVYMKVHVHVVVHYTVYLATEEIHVHTLIDFVPTYTCIYTYIVYTHVYVSYACVFCLLSATSVCHNQPCQCCWIVVFHIPQEDVMSKTQQVKQYKKQIDQLNSELSVYKDQAAAHKTQV